MSRYCVLPLGHCCGQSFYTWLGWALHRDYHAQEERHRASRRLFAARAGGGGP